MMEWKNIYRGLIIGATDVIPGVSGGTVAVLLGIYEQLIGAINGLFSKDWKKHLSFLIPLGIGVVLAIFSLSKLMEWLLQNHPGPTYFFFQGLILGILPFLFVKGEVKKAFKAKHFILLIIGAILVGSLANLNANDGAIIQDITFTTYIKLFFAGILGSSAMILPGISGSFVLLVIGVYPTVISAISNLKLDIIAVTGLGIVVGIIVMSKVINFLFKKFRTGTYAIIIGMVIGSIFVIFPGWPTGSSILISLITFAAGLLTAYTLGKVEY